MFTVETGLIRKIPIVEHSSIKENEFLAPNKYSFYILEPYIASKSMKKVMIRKKCWEDPTSIVSIYLIENLPSHEFLQKGNLEI